MTISQSGLLASGRTTGIKLALLANQHQRLPGMLAAPHSSLGLGDLFQGSTDINGGSLQAKSEPSR